jgi:hypothetical protein
MAEILTWFEEYVLKFTWVSYKCSMYDRFVTRQISMRCGENAGHRVPVCGYFSRSAIYTLEDNKETKFFVIEVLAQPCTKEMAVVET